MEKNHPKTNAQPKQIKPVTVNKPNPLIVNEENKYVLGGFFSLGLNNFFKTVLLVFSKVGIMVKNKNGNEIYKEEKIGTILRTLCKCVQESRPTFEKQEEAWAKYFKLNTNQQVKLQKMLFHHFPILGPIMADEAAYKVNKKKKTNVTDTYTMTYGVTLPECLAVLSKIAQGLVDCRNTDVHYYPYNSIDDLAKQYLIQEDIVRYLVKALVASRRLDKERNSIETEKMEFLTGYAKDDGKALEKYIRNNGFYPKYDQVIKTDGEGNVLYVQDTDKDGNPIFKNGNPVYKQKVDKKTKKPISINGHPVYEPQVKMVERNDFFYKIGGDMTIERNGRVYSTLTGFGLAYFCTIFLSKTQAKQMLSDIGLFERSPYPEELNNIIRDMLSIYRIRSPKGKKLEGSDTKVTLALDMLNELRKCPKELYDVLGPDGQKYFEDEVKHPNERTPEVVKRFRNTDRFPYFAMRYIDETNVFTNIRFQVQLGKLRFKFYPKKCINGEEEIRSLQKEINGFGRLQEIEIKRQNDYKGLLQDSKEKSVKIEGEDIYLDLLQFEKDTEDSKPYITDSRAYYNVHNNRIGLYWKEKVVSDEKNGNCKKTILTPGDYLPPMNEVKDGKAPVLMPAPMAMLSVHELPALIFYTHLLEQTSNTDVNKTAESIIIDKYRSLRQLFLDVEAEQLSPVATKEELEKKLLEKYNLGVKDVPDKLKKYLSGETVDINLRRQELTREKLVKMLKRAIRRRDGFKEDRKKIGDKENKYGKDSFVDVRHGCLARYLSESFFVWQPSNEIGSNKLTGMNFSKLQAELAIFDTSEKYEKIKDIFENAGLISGNYAHPFLPKVTSNRIRNIEELYIYYLNEEVLYIKNLLGIADKKDSDISENKIDFKKVVPSSDVYTRTSLVKGKARWCERTPENIRQLAHRYLELDGNPASIWLPDGIFSEHILELLKTEFKDNKQLQKDLSNKSLASNISYLIRVYFENQLKDYSQPFYKTTVKDGEDFCYTRFAHYYELFNILNNKKERNAYVKVPMIVEEIDDSFAYNATDKNKKLIPRIDANGKPMKENGKPLYKKLIHVDIDNRIEGMTPKEKGNYKTLGEAKDAMRRKLMHMIGEVKDNERAIRRYKTQDMVMFLMAEKLMEDSNATGEVSKSDRFKLKNVCSDRFLSQTVHFECPFKVGNDTIFVTQEVMSLKNLGEFYQLLSDDRLPSLLERLIEYKKKKFFAQNWKYDSSLLEKLLKIKDLDSSTEFSDALFSEFVEMKDKAQKELKFGYSELMGELASYDEHRSKIFKSVHQLEQYVVSNKEFKQFLNNPKVKRFYIDDDSTRDAKRNNFKSLLELLDEGDLHILSKEERELLVSIRNAFSHNHYAIDFASIAKDSVILNATAFRSEPNIKSEDEKKSLITISKLITKKIESLQKVVAQQLNHV